MGALKQAHIGDHQFPFTIVLIQEGAALLNTVEAPTKKKSALKPKNSTSLGTTSSNVTKSQSETKVLNFCHLPIQLIFVFKKSNERMLCSHLRIRLLSRKKRLHSLCNSFNSNCNKKWTMEIQSSSLVMLPLLLLSPARAPLSFQVIIQIS